MVFNKARTRMKETQIPHHKQKSAFETNRRALPCWAGCGHGPKAWPSECPVRAGRPGPTWTTASLQGEEGNGRRGNEPRTLKG